MTTQNAKTMLMFALVATLFIPLTVLATNDGQAVGKTIIKTELTKKTPDTTLELLQQLDDKRNNAASDAERDQIQRQMDVIIEKQKANRPIIDEQRKAEYYQKVEQLNNAIASERKTISKDDKEKVIPFTIIAFDENENALKIGIQQDYATTVNMNKYVQKIRSILGNDVDLIVYNGGDYWQLGSCTTSRLTNCDPDPIVAGVQMQVTGHGYCTTGFKATYNGKSGFVTAGHCADAQTGNNVGQATISNVIGTVEKETYDLGSSSETCDCAFITSTRTIAKQVYGISSTYYPHHTATAAVNDYVKLSGKNSGITTGQVTNLNGVVPLPDGTTLTQVIIGTYASQAGDSGGPVMEAFSATPGFLGTFVAYNSGTGESAYVKVSNFESNFSGISWGY